MDRLPPEIIYILFGQLNKEDLSAMSRVKKCFEVIARRRLFSELRIRHGYLSALDQLKGLYDLTDQHLLRSVRLFSISADALMSSNEQTIFRKTDTEFKNSLDRTVLRRTARLSTRLSAIIEKASAHLKILDVHGIRSPGLAFFHHYHENMNFSLANIIGCSLETFKFQCLQEVWLSTLNFENLKNLLDAAFGDGEAKFHCNPRSIRRLTISSVTEDGARQSSQNEFSVIRPGMSCLSSLVLDSLCCLRVVFPDEGLDLRLAQSLTSLHIKKVIVRKGLRSIISSNKKLSDIQLECVEIDEDAWWRIFKAISEHHRKIIVVRHLRYIRKPSWYHEHKPHWYQKFWHGHEPKCRQIGGSLCQWHTDEYNSDQKKKFSRDQAELLNFYRAIGLNPELNEETSERCLELKNVPFAAS